MTDANADDAAAAAARDYSKTVFLPDAGEAFPMRAGLPKTEPTRLEEWRTADLYAQLRADAADRPRFVLHDGPPYANGHLHIGHALNKILKDFIVRSRQMTGRDAPYVPGWDCHGLPIEWKVEAAFRAKGKTKDQVPVAEFRQACRDYAAEWIDVQRDEFQRLGVVGDWSRPYATMDFPTEAAIVREFLTFAETEQLFRGSKPVMWSPVEQTALAEAEVEYADHQSHTIWVKFPVVSGPLAKAAIVIWTTTPWTIPGNRAIAYSRTVDYGLYEVTEVEPVVDPKTGETKDPWSKPGDRLIVADALAEDVRVNAKIAAWTRVEDVTAEALSKSACAHPFRGQNEAGDYFDFTVPLLDGDHVTDEAGTGFVHTAPSHGQEDFEVWMAHGLGQENIPEMVDAFGAYVDGVPFFAGEEVVRTSGKKAGQEGGANRSVIAKLIEVGALLARGRLTHSYPHSWRSKAPLIFRNTPQWFIRLGDADDPGSLRAKALNAIEETTWLPANSKNRIRTMVADRPDWLISRQRAWGVPLTLFVNADGEYLRDRAVNARIIEAVTAEGADAWYVRPAEDFLGAEYDASEWTKVEDILDVWFDSGSTHAFTLEGREDLAWPADVYLEGSDQHRGWFQSSLLESAGTRGRAPYKTVITHGFTLDEEGRKMSKSLGNTLAPQDVVAQYGADILRLWVATCDYEQDQRVGPNVIKATVDTYRRLRNTLRYLVGAVQDFTPEEAVAPADMPALERAMLHRLHTVGAAATAAYEAYDFKRAFAEVFTFCTNDLSAFYLDVRKDSLYCDPPSSVRRRAARTVMRACLDRLSAWLAPVLVFTAEEAWRAAGGEASVHRRQFPETPAAWRDDALDADWTRLRTIRRVVSGALEIERRDKRIGSSLEARPTVHLADAEDAALIERQAALAGETSGDFLAELFITSQADLVVGEAPSDAFTLDDVAGVAVTPGRATGVKCERSWKYFDPATADPRHPTITPRDAAAVDEWDARHAG